MTQKEIAMEIIEDMLHFQKGSDLLVNYELARLSAEYVAMRCKNVDKHEEFNWGEIQEEIKNLK